MFANANSALWWAIEAFTKSGTRGFYPVTTLVRIVGAVVSVLGISLIAIPTGIISSGLLEHLKHRKQKGEEGKVSHVDDEGCGETQVEWGYAHVHESVPEDLQFKLRRRLYGKF